MTSICSDFAGSFSITRASTKKSNQPRSSKPSTFRKISLSSTSKTPEKLAPNVKSSLTKKSTPHLGNTPLKRWPLSRNHRWQTPKLCCWYIGQEGQRAFPMELTPKSTVHSSRAGLRGLCNQFGKICSISDRDWRPTLVRMIWFCSCPMYAGHLERVLHLSREMMGIPFRKRKVLSSRESKNYDVCLALGPPRVARKGCASRKSEHFGTTPINSSVVPPLCWR